MHSFAAVGALLLKLRPPIGQATSGVSNAIMQCQDCAMVWALPLRAVVTSSTGPGSSRP